MGVKGVSSGRHDFMGYIGNVKELHGIDFVPEDSISLGRQSAIKQQSLVSS